MLVNNLVLLVVCVWVGGWVDGWMVEALLYVHRNRRFIRDGSPGRPPRLPHNS